MSSSLRPATPGIRDRLWFQYPGRSSNATEPEEAATKNKRRGCEQNMTVTWSSSLCASTIPAPKATVNSTHGAERDTWPSTRPFDPLTNPGIRRPLRHERVLMLNCKHRQSVEWKEKGRVRSFVTVYHRVPRGRARCSESGNVHTELERANGVLGYGERAHALRTVTADGV